MAKCPYIELVSVCDIIFERAQRQGQRFAVANQYPHIDQMLAGAAFDLLVDTTDMQEHEHLNRQAILAGKHVWSEKPMANTVAAGQELLELAKKKGARIWGAPTVVNSPQFAFMAKTLAAGTLGRVAAAHAEYGHAGPGWSAFFYQKGGGSMPDLGVYNLTSLTGLLGPAKSVVAMTSIVTPTREIKDKGRIQVTEEDNAMVLLDHGKGVISHVQSGFNYFDQHYAHDSMGRMYPTIFIIGNQGRMNLVGYDWDPRGVDVAAGQQREYQRYQTDKEDYVWEYGASRVAECLATGREPLFTPEHALHVCEIIISARESQATGRRIPLQTTFKWPIVTG
jgi:predicted dehydrogenase